MKAPLPEIYLARHGETAWSLTGQHTGLTDIPLTEHGQRNAQILGDRLRRVTFNQVYTSPLQRAARTCQLAGFGSIAEVDADLVEWNYGEFEGKRTAEIQKSQPGWQLFRSGCPGGESPAQVAQRADRIIARLSAAEGRILLFSSGHILRMLAARWLTLEPWAGALFYLSTASLSILGYDHGRAEPVLRLWNDTSHLA